VIARNLGGAWRFEENWFDASLIIPYGEAVCRFSRSKKFTVA
jgi:hypothetical protein